MGLCRVLVLILQCVLVTQFNNIVTLAAPSEKRSVLENEIENNNDDDYKTFRETYSARVRSFMNTSVDPCDDFYEYACGNFPNTLNDIDTNRKRGNLLDIYYTLIDRIDEILEKNRDPNEEYYEELQIAFKYVNTCVNAQLLPIQPSKEYLAVLKDIGGFPAVDPSWQAATFDWFNMTAHLTRYGIEGFVKEEIFLKHPFPPYYKLPKLGFGFDAYLENIDTKESPGYVHNRKIMRNLLNAYGVTDNKSEAVIHDIFKLWRETLLLEKSIKDSDGCTLAALKEEPASTEFPRWDSFFPIAWETDNFRYNDMSECPCPIFYNKFETIVAKMPQAVANYLALKFLYTLHPNLQKRKFQRIQCIHQIKSAMPFLLAHFYLREHYKKENEIDINTIILNIKQSSQHYIEAADWLDDVTRQEALDKVRSLRINLGYIKDPITVELIKHIKKLNFTDNFDANNLLLAKHQVDLNHYVFLNSELEGYTTPLSILDAVQVNAFYYILENSVNVMAGILHPPVYHPAMPTSVKYGSLGYIIGHELTHGFDDIGSKVDANLTIRNWWSNKSSKEFAERSNCFVNLYSEYKIPGMKKNFNGTAALGENIADSGGVREALHAYRSLTTKNKHINLSRMEQDTLPSLNLTPEQTFFLSFAQIYCSKYTPKFLWQELSDDHPIDKFRILGTLKSSADFAQVYNCPLGSPMNPVQKCRIW